MDQVAGGHRQRLRAARQAHQARLLLAIAAGMALAILLLATEWRAAGEAPTAVWPPTVWPPTVWPHDGELPWRSPRWTVDVNRAGWVELSLLPGVSRRLGERLVAERQRRGAFQAPEDLDQVPGVGPTSLDRWTSFLDW